MREFDYQWKNIPSKNIEYNQDRINEFLNFTRINPDIVIKDKYCLDAGCGNGRYTYAMQKLGARSVDSFDISPEAVAKCGTINPHAFILNIMDLQPDPKYDFVLSWGVLHHLGEPRKAFAKVASQVKKTCGILHIMVYHKDTQSQYEEGRKLWINMSVEDRLKYCNKMIKKYGGDLHGWFDALNPGYNWGFTEEIVRSWFEEEGFSSIELISKHNINMRGHLDLQAL